MILFVSIVATRAADKKMSKHIPKVSVIIPVYNVEKYLVECLDSVINQTLPDIEIICVNDGSTDLSPAVLSKYAQNDKRIKILNKENGGLSSARNAGLRIARGEYVCFLDSDDYIHWDALETLYAEASEKRLEVLSFLAETTYESYNLEKIRQDFFPPKALSEEVMSGQKFFAEALLSDTYRPQAWLYFIARTYLQENKLDFYEGIIHEDNLFTFLLLMSARRTGYLNKKLYFYRIRRDSIMMLPTGTDNFKGYSIVMFETLKYIFEHEFHETLIQMALGLHISRSLTQCQNIYEKLSRNKITEYDKYLELLLNGDKNLYCFWHNIMTGNSFIKQRYDIENSLSFRLGYWLLNFLRKPLALLGIRRRIKKGS